MKVVIFLKSRLFFISLGVILEEICFAASSIFFSNLLAKLYSASIACISVWCSPGYPNTSLIFPVGFVFLSPQSTIVTTTNCQSFIVLIYFDGRKISKCIFGFESSTKA